MIQVFPSPSLPPGLTTIHHATTFHRITPSYSSSLMSPPSPCSLVPGGDTRSVSTDGIHLLLRKSGLPRNSGDRSSSSDDPVTPESNQRKAFIRRYHRSRSQRKNLEDIFTGSSTEEEGVNAVELTEASWTNNPLYPLQGKRPNSPASRRRKRGRSHHHHLQQQQQHCRSGMVRSNVDLGSLNEVLDSSEFCLFRCSPLSKSTCHLESNSPGGRQVNRTSGYVPIANGGSIRNSARDFSSNITRSITLLEPNTVYPKSRGFYHDSNSSVDRGIGGGEISKSSFPELNGSFSDSKTRTLLDPKVRWFRSDPNLSGIHRNHSDVFYDEFPPRKNPVSPPSPLDDDDTICEEEEEEEDGFSTSESSRRSALFDPVISSNSAPVKSFHLRSYSLKNSLQHPLPSSEHSFFSRSSFFSSTTSSSGAVAGTGAPLVMPGAGSSSSFRPVHPEPTMSGTEAVRVTAPCAFRPVHPQPTWSGTGKMKVTAPRFVIPRSAKSFVFTVPVDDSKKSATGWKHSNCKSSSGVALNGVKKDDDCENMQRLEELCKRQSHEIHLLRQRLSERDAKIRLLETCISNQNRHPSRTSSNPSDFKDQRLKHLSTNSTG